MLVELRFLGVFFVKDIHIDAAFASFSDLRGNGRVTVRPSNKLDRRGYRRPKRSSIRVCGCSHNEEPRRPVVSGDWPGPSHSVRGDPPLGRLIDSAGLVFLQLSRAVPRYSLNNHQAARSVSASGSGQMMRELTWISQNLSDRRPSAARSRPPVRSAGLSYCYLYLVTILLVGFG